MMPRIPCVLMRGGSSKGLYFLASDLPWHTAERDRVLLAAMGSPDIRQIDGLGGGDDQTSKVMIVARRGGRASTSTICSRRSRSAATWWTSRPTSGNMLSGVAPFAIERGLVEAQDPVTTVRILDLNTGKVFEAEVQTPAGRVTYQGDYELDGVPGTAAPICCASSIRPAADGAPVAHRSRGGRDRRRRVSCVDFANPVVMIAADRRQERP